MSDGLTNYVTNETDIQGKLMFKCFYGEPVKVEEQLNAFLNKEPICIQKILQSESDGHNGFGITITIAYYKEGSPHFLGDHFTARTLAQKIKEYMKDYWGITVQDVQNFVFEKERIERLRLYRQSVDGNDKNVTGG